MAKKLEPHFESHSNEPYRSPILRYFEYDHLPERLQLVSRSFWQLAYWIEDNVLAGPEKSVALRKLLEAKDAAVRAELDHQDPHG